MSKRRKTTRKFHQGVESTASVRPLTAPDTSSTNVLPLDLRRKVSDIGKAYEKIDGYSVSRKAKAKLRAQGHFDKLENLTYGEINLEEFAKFLLSSGIDLAQVKVFTDIGSGTGKAVLVAAVVASGLQRSIGIEILPELHRCAVDAYDKIASGTVEETCEVEFLCADAFVQEDWLESDVVFVTTTCFTDAAMQRLQRRLDKLKSGAYVITATRLLESPLFRLQKKSRIKYAKGSLGVFLWRKKDS